MEAVGQPPLHNSSIDGIKASVGFDESTENSVVSVQADVCQKSNGVAESAESVDNVAAEPKSPPLTDCMMELETTSTKVVNSASESIIEETAAASTSILIDEETHIKATDDALDEALSGPSIENMEVTEEVIENTEKAGIDQKVEEMETTVAADNVVDELESINDRVFQTEILIETNDNDAGENVVDDTKVDVQDTAGILSELGENIELTEALRSSDVTDHVENNNCSTRQEVFNKEELLDILEGNNEELASNVVTANFQNFSTDKIAEAQLALKQLSRLQKKRKTRKSVTVERLPKIKKSEKKVLRQYTKNNATEKKEENLINVIVNEWEDEEPSEADQPVKLLEVSESLLKSSSDLVEAQETVAHQDEVSVRTSIDSTTADEKTPNLNTASDESQPQRRLGRVIKKKVIFDPDNPDTFTKSKMIVKSKEHGQEKDYLPAKKSKSEQIIQQSKSPISKLQWKKPSPKSCKQHKRLSEVDKLLMDEGAVNMIYQLTPEAQGTKGKKNMKTKAEFIKKIQSSTPDSKEMKFRERKKESKHEEGEAKKILGSKQRPSLSTSVKSPSVTEDFEAHSADDSIIYRRHSSSSYSSSCMSPRRLSDFEVSGPPTLSCPTPDTQNQASNDGSNDKPSADVFMSDSTEPIGTDIINKDDCISIKEKLNSKLNLALNKRKREISKVDKPSKIKKVLRTEDKTAANSEDFKYLSVMFDDKLAEICIRQSGSKYNIEVLTELEKALTLVDVRKDISVTLITSECGTLCSDLDLRSLLENDMEKRTNYAYATAESVRSILQAMHHHSKLVCSGVNGRCSGVGLAMLGLCDIAMASERASFSIGQKSHTSAAPLPGVSVFTAYQLLPQSMLNDLLIFGRRLTAAEALEVGLVTRTLWPERFYEQVRAIAKDITTQSTQNILLKKQLLNLKKSGSESTFLSCLEKERDLLVEYWTSVEGQELLRTLYNTS